MGMGKQFIYNNEWMNIALQDLSSKEKILCEVESYSQFDNQTARKVGVIFHPLSYRHGTADAEYR